MEKDFKMFIIIQILLLVVIVLIGYYVINSMKYEIENNPDIEFIGPPGLQPPRLEYLAIMVLVFVIALGVILKLNKVENEDENNL